MKKYLYFTGILILTSNFAWAQESLSLDDAISLALKHNFDIQLADKNIELAKNNTSIYNSGYLPTLSADGNAGYANNNSALTNQADEVTKLKGIENLNYNGTLAINYLLYNGGSRKYSYESLKTQFELSSSEKKSQIENTLLDVYTTFFNVARNQEQKNTLQEAFDISKNRLERVEAQKKYGQKTTLDVLNAQVDANSDSINLVNTSVQLSNHVRNLNFLLGQDIDKEYVVNKEVILDNNISYETLLQQLRANNNQLKQIELNRAISKLNIKINESARKPTISTSLGYGLNYSNNGPAGFFAVQQSNGLSAGINLSWKLFDGGATKVNVQNAKIALQSQDISKQKISLDLENQISTFWAEYNTQKVVLRNEEINVEISNQNFLKTKELFNLGKVNSLDFRQAQLNLINTKLNLLNAKYNAKIAEVQLKKVAGILAK